MPILNTASSIIDFYKSKGFKPAPGESVPLFGQRKQDFERLGLNKQLGDFRGSATQNTALLNALTRAEKSSGVSIAPKNIQSMINIARGESQPAIQQQAPQQQVQEQPLRLPGGQIISPQDPQFQEFKRSAPFEPQQAPPGSVEEVVIPSQQQAPVQKGIPSEIQQRINQITKVPTAQELSQQASERFFGRPEFPQEQEQIQAEKERVKLQAQKDTEQFISSIASRGLFFSGKKQTGVSAIEADKLSELLGIDRKFALFITKGLQTSAQEVAKEAQAGSKSAMDALEKLGFTINPITGGVEPTLEARKAQQQAQQQQLQAEQFQQQEARREAQATQQAQQFQQTQERLERGAEAQQQRFEQQQQLAEARLAISTAQNQAQMAIAQRRLELAELAATRTGSGLTEINRQLKELELKQKLAELVPSEGQIINKKSGAPTKVDSAFADSIAAGKTMLTRDIPAIRDIVGRVDTGLVRAQVIKGSIALGTSSTDENQLTALIADLNSRLLQLRTGAAVTPQEYERIQPLLPKIENQPKKNKDNLVIFEKNLQAALKNKLDVRGLDIAGGLKPSLNNFIKK